MKAVFRKHGYTLHPVDDNAKTIIDHTAVDDDVLISYKKVRNVQNHRRFFAFIQTAFAMQDHYDTPTMLRKAIQIGAGYCDEIIGLDGNVYFVPKSIAYEDLDEEAFRTLFKDCITAFLNRYGSHISESEFMRIINFD